MSIIDPRFNFVREPGSPPKTSVPPTQTKPPPVQTMSKQGRAMLITVKDMKAPPGTSWSPEEGKYIQKEEKAEESIDKVIRIVKAVSELPKDIVKEVNKTINVANDLVNVGLEKIGLDQEYHPPSLPDVRKEVLGKDTAKFSGLTSAAQVHNAILLQGFEVLRHRISKIQIEFLESLERKVKEFFEKQAAQKIAKASTKAAALLVIKEGISEFFKYFSAIKTAKEQAAIEEGIRAESKAVMTKFVKKTWPGNQKFKDDATRVQKLVMSRNGNR
jgi:hypothetical protein